jgi:hypothetical protein
MSRAGRVGRRMAWLLLWVIVLAGFFAMVEIQIEGGQGWAAGLPTWRIEQHWLLDLFWGGRPMTGYHAWIFSFMFLAFHLPLAMLGRFSWRLEARCLGGGDGVLGAGGWLLVCLESGLRASQSDTRAGCLAQALVAGVAERLLPVRRGRFAADWPFLSAVYPQRPLKSGRFKRRSALWRPPSRPSPGRGRGCWRSIPTRRACGRFQSPALPSSTSALRCGYLRRRSAFQP